MSTPSSAVKKDGSASVLPVGSPTGLVDDASTPRTFPSPSAATIADRFSVNEDGLLGYSTAKTQKPDHKTILRDDTTTTTNQPTITTTTIKIDTGLQLYEPKNNLFTTDEKFLYVHAALSPPMKRMGVKENQLYKAEIARIEQMGYEAALREQGVEEFASTGKARGLVRKTDLGAEELGGKVFTAIVRVWEGAGYVPESLQRGGKDDGLDGGQDGLVEGLKRMKIQRVSSGGTTAASSALSTGGSVLESLRGGAVGIGGSSSWERVYHPTAIADKLKRKYRWTRIDLFKHDSTIYVDTPLQAKFDVLTAAEDVNKNQFQLFAATVKIETSEGSLRDFIDQARDCASVIDTMHSRDAVHALLNKDHEKDDGVMVHGNKIFGLDKDSSTTMQGLTYVEGTTRTLRLNAKGEPIVHEGICQKLFLPATSVAEFVKQVFGLPACGGEKESRDQMSKALQGRMITVNTTGGKETRTIFRISNSTPDMADIDHFHPTWRNKSSSFKLMHPELPMVDVGTKYHPALMPAELCTIFPMQSFTGERTPTLLSALDTRRKQYGTPKEITGKTKLEENVIMAKCKKPALSIDVQDLQLESALGAHPTVLFVHAGVEQVKDGILGHFINRFRNSPIFTNRGMTVAETKAIFLEYRPGHSDAALWKAQLGNAIKQHRTNKQPIAMVVSVQDDKHSKDVYRLVKNLCDVEIGVQSFIVNLSRLEHTVRKFGIADGPQKAANEVIHRMRERNPEPITTVNGRVIGPERDIAIALHISPTSVDDSRVAADGSITKQHTMYLAVFSSRNVCTSELYHTRIVLLGPNEVKEYDPSEHMKEFLQSVVSVDKCHRVTILRSGFMPVMKNAMSDSVGKTRRASSHVHIDLFDSQLFQQDDKNNAGGSMIDRRHSFADGKPVTASRGELANNEYLALRGAINEATGALNQVSYVLLQENNGFSLTKSAKVKITETAAKAGDKAMTAGISFFAVNTGSLNQDANTLSAHRNITVQNDSTLISMTLIGDYMGEGDALDDGVFHSDAIQDVSKQTPSKGDATTLAEISPNSRRSPSTQKPTPPRGAGNAKGSKAKTRASTGALADPVVKGGRKTSLEGAPTTPKSTTQPPGAVADKKVAPRSSIRKSELGKLAMLWRDDNLELSDTKWPIPTHLAHLAAKRAALHLKADRFDKDDDTAPFTLPAVNDDVAKTLYYL